MKRNLSIRTTREFIQVFESQIFKCCLKILLAYFVDFFEKGPCLWKLQADLHKISIRIKRETTKTQRSFFNLRFNSSLRNPQLHPPPPPLQLTKACGQ
jgi:hypothetical protein